MLCPLQFVVDNKLITPKNLVLLTSSIALFLIEIFPVFNFILAL